MNDKQPLNAAEARKANEGCQGAPQYFTYPPPLPISDEDRKRYAARLPKTKRRARNGNIAEVLTARG